MSLPPKSFICPSHPPSLEPPPLTDFLAPPSGRGIRFFLQKAWNGTASLCRVGNRLFATTSPSDDLWREPIYSDRKGDILNPPPHMEDKYGMTEEIEDKV